MLLLKWLKTKKEKKQKKPKMKYTKELKQKVKALFLRTELREGETEIDNRSKTIAKELNLTTKQVDNILAVCFKDK